jgi:putative membrane protein
MYGHGFTTSDWLCGFGTFAPGPFGMILSLLFWGLVIYLIIRGVSYLFGKTTHSNGASAGAMNILSERYARGEITKTDFEQMKKDLS